MSLLSVADFPQKLSNTADAPYVRRGRRNINNVVFQRTFSHRYGWRSGKGAVNGYQIILPKMSKYTVTDVWKPNFRWNCAVKIVEIRGPQMALLPGHLT